MALLLTQLQVKRSQIPNAGKGLFTTKNIKRWNIILEYKGIIRTWNDRKPLRESTQTINHASIKYENISVRDQVKHDVSETINKLLKPEQMSEQINTNLLVKKKERKKKRGLRL